MRSKPSRTSRVKMTRATRKRSGGWAPVQRPRPVRPRIAGNRRFGVPGGTLLHVARLGGSTTVQTGAIAPLGVQLDSIWRIVTISSGLRSPSSRATASGSVESAHRARWGPSSHRSPGRDTGATGTGGTSSSAAFGWSINSDSFAGTKASQAEIKVQ